MRRFLQSLLAYLARAAIRRQRPLIIGVTGSVGKTSTREAIRAVLASDRNVRSSPKNYNNEIGFPVAIIGGCAPGRSPICWSSLIMRGCWLACWRSLRYPEALVLEYGADHPGDIAYLMRIATPSIGIVTAVGPAHTEFFGSIERVKQEKRRLVAGLARDGIAVLNHDNEDVHAMRERVRAKVVTYGFHEDADVRAIEYQVTYKSIDDSRQSRRFGRDPDTESSGPIDDSRPHRMPTGIAFKVVAGGSAVPIHLTGCLGRSHASAALAAIAVGRALDLNLVEISHALAAYDPLPGRMRIISGIKQTVLIDDTYNASPLAEAAAIDAVSGIETASRRIAVLGDMLELGVLADREHARMGELVAARPFDVLVTVGEMGERLAVGARSAGMPADRVHAFASAAEAGRFVQDLLHPGDVVLVKGSQGMRMERVVKELMDDPLHTKDLLCRQDDEWLTRA